MNDGEHYTVLEKDGIVKYSYKTGKKIETILEAKIQDYTFSHNESKVLVLNEQQPIYRHSFLGKYHVVNLSKNGEITALNNGNWVQEPKFSPDGRFVAFISGNNLYYQDLSSEKITQITFDGEKNKKASYTIDLLNLNDNRLCDIRKTFIIKYMSSVEVREYLQEFPSLRRYLELLQS